MRSLPNERLFTGSLLLGITAIFALMIASIYVTQISSAVRRRATARVTYTLDMLGRLDEIQALVAAAESAQRSYVLDGDAAPVQSYAAATRGTRARIGELERLTADNPPQAERARQLRQRVGERLEQMDATLQAGPEELPTAARDRPAQSRGEATMDAVGQVIATMREAEKSLLAQRLQSSDASSRRSHGLNLFSGALGLLALGAFVFLVDKTLRAREQAADEIARPIDDSAAPIRDSQGAVAGVVLIFRDVSLERTHGGLGIGLNLVRQLVEMHGGRVEVRSDGVGKGSEFVVHFPRRDAAPAPVAALLPAAAPLAALTQARTGKASPAVGSGPGSGRRILVVDDNADSADSLAMLLQLQDHETAVARDGVEAVTAALSSLPDVVLLDIGLPRMSGYEAARRICMSPLGGGILLMAITGWGQDADRVLSRAAGFDQHLVKPVDIAVLSALLERSARAIAQ